MNNKNSEIILCKNIKMDKENENVLSYSENDMVTLCRNNSIYTANKYSFLGNTNYLDISCSYSLAMYSNYVAFKNPIFGDKWIFGFVTDIKLLNPSTTRIYFETDVWSTWYSKFVVGEAFIEREHVSDDTIGKHTIPENLETGDYIINNYNEFGDTELNKKYIVMCYTGNPQSLFPSYGSGKEYTGIYTGFNYLILASGQDADSMIKGFSDNGALEKIYSLFTIPDGLIRSSVHWYNGPNATGSDVIEIGDGNYPMFALVPTDPVGSHNEITIKSSTNISINTTINGYTPKNNKLFTSQFNYLYVTNNTGIDIKYNYEDFINNTPAFKIIGSISVGQNIRLIPLNYKKYDTTSVGNLLYTYGVSGSKYPTLGWVGDSYTNWLTQNAINITTGLISSGVSVAGSALTGNVGGSFNGMLNIANMMGEIRQHQLVSETGQGNINCGDLTYSTKKMNFTIYQMSIKEEYASIIDKYFSRFGYKVNEVKTPNLKSRTKFNFIKVGGMDELVHGEIPASDLVKINSIFRKGVTIFHDYNDFGNYTINNPIRTN